MSHESIRLFLALWPDAGVRNALAQYRDAWRWNPKAAVVPKENLHLTLHFIGNIPCNRLPLLRKYLRVSFNAFDLRFGRPDVWRRDVAILRLDVLPDSLVQLHAALRLSLQRLDLRVDARDLQPHVTLARRSADSISPAQEPAIDWHVTGYTLVESRLSTKAEYIVVEKYSCGDSG
ncbi:MAG: RNA 2',3'-cyclic phosphodiesterase [Sterolibacterium sp.]|nr:RNA 2',3'-cyclic phosphodiesterase [Sterolibacterium sp.]